MAAQPSFDRLVQVFEVFVGTRIETTAIVKLHGGQQFRGPSFPVTR
jgi:hypothetical protein